MTTDEATAVIKIMLTADSFCGSCQHSLIEQFKGACPEHAALAADLYQRSSELERALMEARYAWEDGGWKGDKPQAWQISWPAA